MHQVTVTAVVTRANKARNISAGFWKAVEGVGSADTARAFLGPFLPAFRPVELPEGTVLIRKDYAKGGWLWYVGKVDATQPSHVLWGDAWPMKNFTQFRDHVAQVLGGESLEGWDEEYAAESDFVDFKAFLVKTFEDHHVDFASDSIPHIALGIIDYVKKHSLLGQFAKLPMDSKELPQQSNEPADDAVEAVAA